ncbi:hypothetical protein [Bradyrhizobium sp. 27S5]
MAKKADFTQLTLMAMAHELEQAEEAVRNMRAMYNALAKKHNVRPLTKD